MMSKNQLRLEIQSDLDQLASIELSDTMTILRTNSQDVEQPPGNIRHLLQTHMISNIPLRHS